MRVYIETLTMSSQEPPKKKSKQVENKQGTLLSWVKRCTSDLEPGVVEETIRIRTEQMLYITLVDVANDFVWEKENRKQLFGKFSADDIPNKFSISLKSTQTEN